MAKPTFRATGRAEPFHVTWGPCNPESALCDEAERMLWARRWVQVPQVLEPNTLIGEKGRWAAHVDLRQDSGSPSENSAPGRVDRTRL